ncbi:MAG: sulfite exporter TauE/SafE family protein [Chitinophagales bacterium]
MEMYYSALIIALAGSLHCAGMCGPLVISLHLKGLANSPITFIQYHAARIAMYVLQGVIFGLVGFGVFAATSQQVLSIIAGLAILIAAFFTALTGRSKFSLFVWFNNFLHRLFKGVANKNKNLVSLASGVVNGLLPCGLVYIALSAALAIGKPTDSALYMLSFGIGTVPAMLIISLTGKYSSKLRLNFRKVSFVLTISAGLFLVVRGLNLGIPYISPQYNFETKEMQCCTIK